MFTKIKNWFEGVVSNTMVKIIKMRSPIIKTLLENPEQLKLEAKIERDEVLVKIKKDEPKS